MRVGYDIVLLILILTAPYWIYLPLMLLGIILFPLFLEAIFFGLLVDVVYGGAGFGRFLWGFPIGSLNALLVLFAAPLRESLRINHA